MPEGDQLTMIDLSQWQSLAEDVLSLLCTEPYIEGDLNFFKKASHERMLKPYHLPPGRWRSLYEAVLQLHLTEKNVNWNNLVAILPSTADEAWYTELSSLADPIRMFDFDENVERLIELGNRMSIISTLEHTTESLRKGEGIEFAVQNCISDITSLGDGKIEDETAIGTSTRVSRIFEADPVPGICTGIDFIDEAIGGLRSQKMLVLAGAYKSRKTTIMLNWILAAIRQGKKPAILSFENSIEITTLQLIAMLAVEWLFRVNKIEYTDSASAYWISASDLMMLGKTYQQKWAGLKAEAVNYARETWESFGKGIRIYDRSTNGGSLSNIASIKSVIKRDMHLYGGDFFAIDHQGLIDANGEIYESTRYVSKELQVISRITEPHSIHLLVLAQLNEEAIKRKKSSSYSSGVKGGGDTNANADYVLRTTPIKDPNGGQDKYYDNRVDLQIKHNRWGASTARHTVKFHPQSGLYRPDENESYTQPEAINVFDL